MKTSIEEKALHHHLRRHMLRLVNLTDESCGGTATPIKIKGTYFLATAAHVVPQGHDVRILATARKEEQVNAFENVIRDETADVAVIELKTDLAEKLDRDFLPPTRIAINAQAPSHSPATLVGYPGNLIETLESPGEITRSFRPLTFITSVLPRSKWPRNVAWTRAKNRQRHFP